MSGWKVTLGSFCCWGKAFHLVRFTVASFTVAPELLVYRWFVDRSFHYSPPWQTFCSVLQISCVHDACSRIKVSIQYPDAMMKLYDEIGSWNWIFRYTQSFILIIRNIGAAVYFGQLSRSPKDIERNWIQTTVSRRMVMKVSALVPTRGSKLFVSVAIFVSNLVQLT